MSAFVGEWNLDKSVQFAICLCVSYYFFLGSSLYTLKNNNQFQPYTHLSCSFQKTRFSTPVAPF